MRASRRAHTATAAAILAAVLPAGCGGTATKKPVSSKPAPAHPQGATAGVCRPSGRAALARFLGAHELTTAAVPGTGNNSQPQCVFTAREPSAKRVQVTVNVDTQPQPYARLERAVVEETQVFTAQRMVPAPQTVPGLGLDADWFPAEKQLMWTDGVRLITVSVDWRGAPPPRARALARAVSRAYVPHTRASNS